MKIGMYKLGRYHAIIEKIWEDNTSTFETRFASETDLIQSMMAIDSCIAKKIKCGMDNPMQMLKMNVYRGEDAVSKLSSL